MPIEVRNLSHIYAEGSPFRAVAVQDVSFTLNQGEIVGIIGHTGSGKSTLIQHLNGLMKPTGGTVLVDGQDLWANGTDLRKVRHKVGLVFQYPEYQLFEETVARDIAFGPRNLGLGEEEARQKAWAAAKSVGLTAEMMEKSPFDLSGGQKRRVAIAGVLAMEPETLILDEPAAGLDPAGRRDMLELLMHLHEEKGMTLIMVSHSMSDVAKICQRVMVLNHGKLVMDGETGEVFSHTEELQSMGLGVPEGAELARELRKQGFAIPEGIWRMEDVEKAILQELTNRGVLKNSARPYTPEHAGKGGKTTK